MQDLIKSVETFLVAPRWLFVRIETNSGLVGWGEGTLEGRSETVAVELENLKGFLIGEDSSNIARIHHACLLYTSPSPRDKRQSRMPSSA